MINQPTKPLSDKVIGYAVYRSTKGGGKALMTRFHEPLKTEKQAETMLLKMPDNTYFALPVYEELEMG